MRPAYVERTARLVQEHRGAPITVLIEKVLDLLEEAAVQAAGRGAATVLPFLFDLGRQADICRQARKDERARWARS